MQAVGADDPARCDQTAVGVEHPPNAVAGFVQAGDCDAFTDIDADRPGAIEECTVQLGPANSATRTTWKPTLDGVALVEVPNATERPMRGQGDPELVEHCEAIRHETFAAGFVDRR